MKINYQQILKKNMINVLKDVLKVIEKDNLKEGHHLYITFNTENKKRFFCKEKCLIMQYHVVAKYVQNNTTN